MAELDIGTEAQVRTCASPGTIALTFDDGPDPSWTASVLAELGRYGARATFFLDAPRALAHPDLIRAMLGAGHEAGFHCVQHIRHSAMSEEALAADAGEGLEILGWLGVRPTAWRAPWGVVTATTRRVAAELGLTLWGWSFDSHDWRGDGRDEMLAALVAQGGLADGTVALMHDAIGPGAKRVGCAETVRLTAALLEAAQAKGLRAATVSEVGEQGDRVNAFSAAVEVSPLALRLSALLDPALVEVAAGAAKFDREPRFPAESIAALSDAGVLTATVGAAREEAPVLAAWGLVRRVAAADASVGRILDGHLNAIERLEVAAGPDLRDAELEKLEGGSRLLGVWGADPGPDEGPPARLVETGGARVLRGVKTFCSGAGGIDAALVMVGSDDGLAPRLVLVECDERVAVDRDWYRAAGLRASESHRVVFADAPVLAVLGEPGELSREPWFSRDAMRTAASWAGMVDAAAAAAIAEIGARRADEPLAALAAGRIGAARGTVDGWLAKAAAAADEHRELRVLSVQMRAEIDRAAKTVLECAAVACGSHPFVTAGPLDRARRDLETFLLQHRLEPMLARIGAESLDGQ